MSRIDRSQLQCKRPPEWDRFEAAVEEKFGATTPYCGFVLDRTWHEYQDDHPAEEYVNRLLRAVGIHDAATREKNRSRDARDGDAGRVWVSVSVEVKREMERFASEVGVPSHEVLRALVCWYLDGGLLGLLTEKLERAVPETEEQLAALDPDDDRELTTDEKKPRWLASHLMPDDGSQVEFTADNFDEALKTMPYGGRDTDHMRNKWLPVVLDRLDSTRHPKEPGLFIPEERAREYADDPADLDAPAVDRLPYDDLSDEERVHGLRIEAVRKAADRANGRYALKVEAVREEVFDSGPSKRKAKALMDKAAQTDEFSTDVIGGQKRLKADLSEVDHGLLSDAGLDTDGSDETTETEETDAGDAEEQMDALTNAKAVTDGE